MCSRHTDEAGGDAMSRSTAIRLFATLVLGLLVGHAAPVLAGNFGSNVNSADEIAHPCDATLAAQCVANNGTHTVYKSQFLSANMVAATNHGITQANNLTYVSAYDVGTSNADVTVSQGHYGNSGWWAYTRCVSGSAYGGADPYRWCRPQEIRYNMTHPSGWYNTAQGREAVACHEMGHSLGLRHTFATDSCMHDAWTAVDVYNSHDKAVVNGHYD